MNVVQFYPIFSKYCILSTDTTFELYNVLLVTSDDGMFSHQVLPFYQAAP